jgi:hypothetical protein
VRSSISVLVSTSRVAWLTTASASSLAAAAAAVGLLGGELGSGGAVAGQLLARSASASCTISLPRLVPTRSASDSPLRKASGPREPIREL